MKVVEFGRVQYVLFLIAHAKGFTAHKVGFGKLKIRKVLSSLK